MRREELLGYHNNNNNMTIWPLSGTSSFLQMTQCRVGVVAAHADYSGDFAIKILIKGVILCSFC